MIIIRQFKFSENNKNNKQAKNYLANERKKEGKKGRYITDCKKHAITLVLKF